MIPDVNVWGAFWTALKNGFGNSVKPGLENAVDIRDVPKKY
jgi:hypothetical protein